MLFISVFSEFFLRKYIINSDMVYQSSLLYKSDNNKNTVWGDSAAMQSIYFLDGFSNFSGPSDNYQEIEKKIKNYYLNIDEGKVVLHLSLNGFAEYRDRGIREEDLSFFFDKNNPILFILKKRFQIRLFNFYQSYIKNKFQITNKYVINNDGSVTLNQNFVPPKDIDIFENHKYYPKLDFSRDENYKALNRITEYLQKKGIKICLITAPFQKDFREKRLDMNRFKEIREYYSNLSLSKKIEYYDFVEYKFPVKYFADGVHLNLEGSKAFTEIINKTCKFI